MDLKIYFIRITEPWKVNQGQFVVGTMQMQAVIRTKYEVYTGCRLTQGSDTGFIVDLIKAIQSMLTDTL